MCGPFCLQGVATPNPSRFFKDIHACVYFTICASFRWAPNTVFAISASAAQAALLVIRECRGDDSCEDGEPDTYDPCDCGCFSKSEGSSDQCDARNSCDC